MTYTIEYEVLDKFGQIIKKGDMRVKNCLSDLQAKSKLEDYLKRKYDLFDKMIVHSCLEDNELVGIFKDIFGGMFND